MRAYELNESIHVKLKAYECIEKAFKIATGCFAKQARRQSCLLVIALTCVRSTSESLSIAA